MRGTAEGTRIPAGMRSTPIANAMLQRERTKLRVRQPRWYHLDEQRVNPPAEHCAARVARRRGPRGVRMATPYMLFEQPRAFRGPSRVWFGSHAADRIADSLAELGVRPGAAFLVTDAVVERLGLARGVAAGLTAAGYEVHRYADIPGEPSVEV